MRALVGLFVVTATASSMVFVPALMAAGGWARPPAPALAAGVPPGALRAYQDAAGRCPGLSWTVLAGIGEVESDHGRSTELGVREGANPAGAEGPMQFLPDTFAAYGADAGTGDGDSPNPYDLADAAQAAARMLCASGASSPGGLRAAIWSYNHSDSYVDEVLGWAARYAAVSVDAGRVAASWALAQLGHPYGWGQAGPDAFDCSGLVMRAWQAAGVALPRVASDQYRAAPHVPVTAAEVGDLVFFSPDPSDTGAIDHVGLVVGPGLMVDAPHSGAVVRVTPFYDGLVADAARPG